MKDYKGQYCIVRGDRSGVFAGIITDRNGQEVSLTDCRCLWYWDGAASIMQIAKDGVKNVDDCRFTVTVDDILITDAIEIIPATNEAENIIRGVHEWKQ